MDDFPKMLFWAQKSAVRVCLFDEYKSKTKQSSETQFKVGARVSLLCCLTSHCFVPLQALCENVEQTIDQSFEDLDKLVKLLIKEKLKTFCNQVRACFDEIICRLGLPASGSDPNNACDAGVRGREPQIGARAARVPRLRGRARQQNALPQRLFGRRRRPVLLIEFGSVRACCGVDVAGDCER
jgi:hypothetical protein